jgi:hypothetical protein
VYDSPVAKQGERPGRPKVVHRQRPEIGVGEVNEIIAGKPPVLQVYWPKIERYGYYLATDVARVDDGDELRVSS